MVVESRLFLIEMLHHTSVVSPQAIFTTAGDIKLGPFACAEELQLQHHGKHNLPSDICQAHRALLVLRTRVCTDIFDVFCAERQIQEVIRPPKIAHQSHTHSKTLIEIACVAEAKGDKRFAALGSPTGTATPLRSHRQRQAQQTNHDYISHPHHSCCLICNLLFHNNSD